MTIFSLVSRGAGASPKQTNHALLKIIRDNFDSQYASQVAALADFRDAIAAHGIEDDDTLLADFRTHVPLSDYDSYKPFVDKFNAQPCKEEDVLNMFSPGLPDFFAMSSATSGTSSKLLPRYNHNSRLGIQNRPYFDPNDEHPVAGLYCTGYRDLKVVEGAYGEVVRRIPLCIGTGGYLRRCLGWYTDDESRMSHAMSGYAVPWAATVIGYFPSFLIIHGLFFLANKRVYQFRATFAAQFVDLIRHIDEHWDMLVSCIKDGTLPDLKGIGHVREYLQAHFHANPERAAELLDIGPPLSSEGWLARVWPNVNELLTICNGPFATVLPKVRFVLGPNVSIRSSGYGSSEARVGDSHNVNILDEFVLKSEEVFEFLDITLNATRENLRQSWEVEVGKYYEPIVTTRDGLWRYRLGDVVHIVGYDTKSSSPIFKYSGRRSMTIHLLPMQVTDDQLLAAIQNFSSEDTVPVHEFTTMVDDRALVSTVSFFIETAGLLGPNAHSARQRIFDALVLTSIEYKHALDAGQLILPTIRIVKAGTFAEYRQWKSEKAGIASGQIKVPPVLFKPSAQEWILERVVQEL